MKKIIFLIAVVLFSVSLKAQTQLYNKWSISGEYGIHLLADPSATVISRIPSFGLDVRYNPNIKIGIGLSGGADIMKLEDYNFKSVDLLYSRANLEAYLNPFSLLDLYSKRFSVLFHGGPGFSYIKTNNNYEEIVPNLRGGMSVLIRITSRISFKSDMSVVSNYLTDKTIDGSHSRTNAAANSLISNVSVGLTFSIGRNKRHIDYYVPVESKEIAPIINNYKIDTTINYTYNSYVNNKYIAVDTTQYVFFDNDKYVIKDNQLNAIFKTFVTLVNNPTYTLIIKGWASNSEDSTLPTDSNMYNITLSENRANVVKQKLVDMGISENRIKTSYYGKDKSLPNVSVHDAARRVELLISIK